jgi:aspartyl-tRNA(Asn)/glutamyl-tRNA(Gln) amidotransferase subunit A
MTLHWLTLTALQSLLRRGELSSETLVDALLRHIEQHDGALHAFTEVYAEPARAMARAADQARASGLPLGPLHGLPIVLKDLLEVEGRICTLGSAHYRQRRSMVTSATVERLLQAGMVPLGKLQMTEFAFGGWGTNLLMGAPRNPWDPRTHRVAGGSSSGTGVAVAAGYAPVGIGSDTGGSVRIPSAFNGLTGLKVTFGRISLHGTGLLSWTLDSIGPMARCVRDCALLLDALVGPDPRDPQTLSQPIERFASDPLPVRGLRLAMPPAEQLPPFMDPGVLQAWETAARVFASRGVQVQRLPLPDGYFELASSTGCIIASEAYSLHRELVDDPQAALDPAVRRRMKTAEGFAPAAYAQALRTMQGWRQRMARWFEPFDAVLLPTMAIPAPALSTIDEDSPIPGALTRPANYLGLCGLSQPAGLVDGLPVGIQLVGKPWGERTVLALGQAFESETAHHAVHPDLGAFGRSS